jgi:hypothetical protein
MPRKETESGKQDEPRNEYLPEWARVMLMNWPRTEWLTPESDFRLAMRTLERNMGGMAANDELMQVVDFMAGPDYACKYAPSLAQFKVAIFTYRKRNRASVQGYQPGTDHISDVKALMLRARTWLDRWNVMIQPTLYGGLQRDSEPDECELLNSWACGQWREWEEETFRIKQGFAADIRRIFLSVGRRA